MDKCRKPNPTQRRRDLCDTAIQLLAADGAKGLSHLKVDHNAGVPGGTTSFYFRTRSALLRAVAERVAELDLGRTWPALERRHGCSHEVTHAASWVAGVLTPPLAIASSTAPANVRSDNPGRNLATPAASPASAI